MVYTIVRVRSARDSMVRRERVVQGLSFTMEFDNEKYQGFSRGRFTCRGTGQIRARVARPDPTRDIGNLLIWSDLTRPVRFPTFLARPDPHGFENSLTRPIGLVMTRE